MFWTFILSFDILATFPNIGQIFVQYSGPSDQLVLENVIKFKFHDIQKKVRSNKVLISSSMVRHHSGIPKT